MISWTLKKDDEVIIEGPIEVIISTIRRMGDNFILRVYVKDELIEIVGQKTEFDRSEEIRKGMRDSQLEKFRKHKYYVEDPNYKFCTACKISKKIDEFGYRNDSRDGRARQCKECVSRKARVNRRKKG